MAKATLNLMWRYPMAALLAFFCLSLAASASATRGAESVNGIAAVVNDKVITYSEVRDVVEPRERLLRSQYTGEELVKKITDLRKAALQDLIDRELIIQAFEKDKLVIPQYRRQVDEVIKETSAATGTPSSTMEREIPMSRFRDGRQKIIVMAMRAKNVKSNDPPREDRRYYPSPGPVLQQSAIQTANDHDPGTRESGGGVAQIVVDGNRAKLITEPLTKWRSHSEDSTRDLGGDWGWIDDRPAPELSQVAFGLKPGEIKSRQHRWQSLHFKSGSARWEVKPLSQELRIEISIDSAGPGARLEQRGWPSLQALKTF